LRCDVNCLHKGCLVTPLLCWDGDANEVIPVCFLHLAEFSICRGCNGKATLNEDGLCSICANALVLMEAQQ
jgi:hypothetical protein